MPILQRYTRRDFERFYARGDWTSDHLLDVAAAHATASPDRLAVVDGERRTGRAELQTLSNYLAQRFVSDGIAEGDIVAVQLPNSLHLVAVLLALLRIGAAANTVNAAYRFADLQRMLKTSRPKFFVHTGQYKRFAYGPLLDDLESRSGLRFQRCLVDTDLPLERACGSLSSREPDFRSPDPDAICLLGATSGSTGDPKIFMHTHNTQFNEARTLNRVMGISADDPFLAFAPLTHRGAYMWGFFQALAIGAPLILQREYSPDRIMRCIDQERVATMFAIPNQAEELLSACERTGASGSSMKVLMLSGAPVPPELIHRVREQWPSCAPVSGYGSSETGYAVVTRPHYTPEQLQTSGMAIDGMEVRVDPASEIGGTGEFVIRGAFSCAGYYANQEATDQAYDPEGWFRTGDLGYIDSDGNARVTGRLKNVIIRSGLKIQAEEIEQVLSTHPQIERVVVVGMSHRETGERAVACVVPFGDGDVDLANVSDFLERQGVAKFKWPEAVRVMENLPLGATGKIDRVLLRKMLETG